MNYGIPAPRPAAAPAPEVPAAEEALIALDSALRAARMAGVTYVAETDLRELQDDLQDVLAYGYVYRAAKAR